MISMRMLCILNKIWDCSNMKIREQRVKQNQGTIAIFGNDMIRVYYNYNYLALLQYWNE